MFIGLASKKPKKHRFRVTAQYSHEICRFTWSIRTICRNLFVTGGNQSETKVVAHSSFFSRFRRDFDCWTRWARIIQTWCRPPYALNKPAMFELKIVVEIPERFRKIL